MTAEINEALFPALEAIRILSPTCFRLGQDHAVEVSSYSNHLALPGQPDLWPRDPLVRALQSLLYTKCYTRRFVSARESAAPSGAGIWTRAEFLLHVTQANHSHDGLDPGWEVYGSGQRGEIFVKKGELIRCAMSNEHTFGGIGTAGQPFVNLRVQRECASAGFYIAVGTTLGDYWDEHNLVRFYFHTNAELAIAVMHHLTAGLNQFLIPFRLKTLLDPFQYDRADATVLYVSHRSFQAVARIVAQVNFALNSKFEPSIPLLTKRLFGGVGVAEDPGNGESFGMHRCRLIAEAIVEAWARGIQTPAERFQSIEDRFRREGIDLAKPYLRAGSADWFEVPDC